MSTDLSLIECFQTYQGEGPDTGKRVLLTRFKYCNLKCSFCDTAVKMRIGVEGFYKLAYVQNMLDRYHCGLLITGGEPTFGNQFFETLDMLYKLKFSFANVETNGYNLARLLKSGEWSKYGDIKFIFSPKIFCEKTLYRANQITKDVYSHPNVYIKIVYQKNDYISQYCEKLSVLPGSEDKVWLMPLGETYEKQHANSADVLDACEEYKFNFSSRVHIMYNFL